GPRRSGCDRAPEPAERRGLSFWAAAAADTCPPAGARVRLHPTSRITICKRPRARLPSPGPGPRRKSRMSDTGTANGKVVVIRAMSLDGFIAGRGDAMDWVVEFLGPEELREQAAATGAMLVGRRTAEVGDRMEAEKPGSVDYPFSGPVFVLTHSPPEPPGP